MSTSLPERPNLSLDPSVATSGSTITVTGNGFRPDDLDPDGYTPPYYGSDLVFIGFKENAPDLTYDMWGTVDTSYYFLLYFYQRALYYQKTIKNSLDYASTQVRGVTFGQSNFYNGAYFTDPSNETGWIQMKVYGDGSHQMS